MATAATTISGFGPNARVVLTALKEYGMLLADNGSPWYITGAPDSRWDDNEMHALGTLTGADFEVVDTSGVTLGRVTAVEANPAHDLLVLEGGTLVPMVFLVRTEPGRVVVDLPEGLLDL